MRKQFYKYVIPSVLAFALSGVYAIVDGFFIGNSVGDIGLAAINIAYPITALIQSIGTGIGIGGSVELSINIGKNDIKAQKSYFTATIFMLILASILCTAILYFSSPRLLTVFGAEGELHSYAMDYISIIILGSVFQIMGTGLVPLIRNVVTSSAAMLAMLVGFATNIILDYTLIYIYSLGIAGAAIASITGQGLTMAICIGILAKKSNYFSVTAIGSLSGFIDLVKHIIAVGLSPFGLTFSPNITLIVINKSAIVNGGDVAVSCYAVIAYILCVVQLLLQGVGDGCQPILSRYYGEGNKKLLKLNRSIAYRFTFALSLVCTVLMIVLRSQIPILFGTSESVAKACANAFPIFSAGLIFFGFTRVTTSYFYATQHSLPAYVLIYGEPVLLFIILLFIPHIFGINGVWAATPIVQVIMACLSLIISNRKKYKI